MATSGLDWKAPVRFLTGSCAVLFGVCAVVELAQAQYVPAPIPPPPPVFNPSSPNVVPQPSYKPITPTTPSVGPGNAISAPVGPELSTMQRHRRTTVAKTSLAEPRVAERHVGKTRRVHRNRAVALGPVPAVAYSSYYAPAGYGYGCAWRRSWDGHWFRTSPCS